MSLEPFVTQQFVYWNVLERAKISLALWIFLKEPGRTCEAMDIWRVRDVKYVNQRTDIIVIRNISKIYIARSQWQI